MSEETTKLAPEVPFNGIIVARESCSTMYSGSPSAGVMNKVCLLIVSEDELHHEQPTFVEHSFVTFAEAFPEFRNFLREGHKVRVTSVCVRDSGIYAIKITFDMAQFLSRLRAELPQPQKEHNDE